MNITNSISSDLSLLREENFPIDTVKQIFDDIEKLFESDDSGNESAHEKLNKLNLYGSAVIANNTSVQSAKSVERIELTGHNLCESNRLHFMLNDVMKNVNEKHLSLFDYIQLCSFELNNLEEEIELQTKFKTFERKIVSNKRWSVKINELHILLWNLFNLHEKLANIFANNTCSHNSSTLIGTNLVEFNCSGSGDGDHNEQQSHQCMHKFLQSDAIQVISIWYNIAEKIKDSITMTKTVNDLLSSVNLQHLQQLWKLTRLIRTLYWSLVTSKIAFI